MVKGILNSQASEEKSTAPSNSLSYLAEWEHEDASAMMIRYAYEDLRKTDDLNVEKLEPKDIDLMCALVKGDYRDI